MPWEIRIISADSHPSLGSIEQVQRELLAVVPEIRFFRDASGQEKLATMEGRGIEVPKAIREHWLRSTGAFEGSVEYNQVNLHFYLGKNEAEVTEIGIEVRGKGSLMPIIDKLKEITGWKIVGL